MLDQDQIAAAAEDLDPLPRSVVELARLVTAEEPDFDAIEACLASDPVLTGSCLRASNSAMLGGVQEITTIPEAIMRLGGRGILTIAIGASVRSRVAQALPEYGLDEGDLWEMAIQAACAAEEMPGFARVDIPAEAVTCALLLPLGRLVLARFLNEDLCRMLARSRVIGRGGELRAERELLGVDHSELSGLVAGTWKLPLTLSEALSDHGRPDTRSEALCDAVHVAAQVVEHLRQESPALPEAGAMERLGMSPDSFLALTAEVYDRQEAMSSRFGS